jgi:hypothetical protein
VKIYVFLFLSSLLYVGLRSFQQRNVTNDNYGWVVPTSVCMAAVDAALMLTVVKQGWSLPLVLSVGIGGGIGCIVAMKFHKRYVLKRVPK